MHILSFLLLLICFVFVSHAQLTPRAQADLVTNLPSVTFQYSARMFAGYLKPDSTKLIYYWYFESQRSPDADPLLVWLEGGPGCSGVGSVFEFNGPFHPNKDDQTLFENVFAWNKLANILYIEAPAPVGFSHFTGNTTVPPSDDSTAVDNYNSLLDFFNNVMPNLKSRPFYLSGHSYAGAYVPMLTIQIIKGMKANEFQANFQGILVGNGVWSEKRQHNTLVPYMYYHGLIGSSMWNQLKSACCPATCMTECDFWSHMVIAPSSSDYNSDNSLCGNLTWITTEWDQWGTENDMYNIYQDCYAAKSAKNHRLQGLNLIDKQSTSFSDGANQNYDSTDDHNGFDCWRGHATKVYLNRPDVQNALHVNMANYTWTFCSRYVERNFNRSVYELDAHLDYILQNSNISILMYAGDVDLVCNFMMHELFINDVAQKNNLKLLGDRSPWMFRGIIAGYQRIFDRIHHLTVKGSGHLVPTDRPGPALQMLANFLFNRNSANYSIATPVSTDPQPLLPQYQAQLPTICTTTSPSSSTTSPTTTTTSLSSTTANHSSSTTSSYGQKSLKISSTLVIASLLLVGAFMFYAV